MVTQQPLETLQLTGAPGVFIANPPYGERLSDRKTCERLYAGAAPASRTVIPAGRSAQYPAIPGFERCYGRKADKVRRLYNGRLECNFYIYR